MYFYRVDIIDVLWSGTNRIHENSDIRHRQCGPRTGNFGPAFSWAAFPDAAKWILSALMLIGRLEIFGILLLFPKSSTRADCKNINRNKHSSMKDRNDREESAQHFLQLIRRSQRGVFKVYIGMIAGVGKTYRMLQEAHDMLNNGVDVKIGYVETHGRAGTEALLAGLPIIPRRKIYYKGKELEEMDLDAIFRIHPEFVVVDELAHTNVEGSRNEKRWQDVMELLDAGNNVISAVNIQHIESLNEEVQGIAGIEVKERIPDRVLEEADEVVNIDLTAEELITRLKAGKIYRNRIKCPCFEQFLQDGKYPSASRTGFKGGGVSSGKESGE